MSETVEGGGYNIRFRHVSGDFGPYVFPKSCTVFHLKEKVLEEWCRNYNKAVQAAGSGSGSGSGSGQQGSQQQMQMQMQQGTVQGEGGMGTTGLPSSSPPQLPTTSGAALAVAMRSPPPPASATDLRIIFGGRMLENQKLVKELQHSMGNPQGTKLVTMHVVVRPPAEDKGTSQGGRRKRQGNACCAIQ